ncbi:MAG: hypothetical protein HZB46_02160 [Solirubrobacterales bacterium]|nr:hypothetical protein [Solirubrobacterales bacterium]
MSETVAQFTLRRLEVPPLPPHITVEQARKLASALAHGDPERGRIVKESLRGKLHEFLAR